MTKWRFVHIQKTMNAVLPPTPLSVFEQIEALGAKHNELLDKGEKGLSGFDLRRFCGLQDVIDKGLSQAQAAGNQALAQDWKLSLELWEGLCQAIRGRDGRSHCCDQHAHVNPVEPL